MKEAFKIDASLKIRYIRHEISNLIVTPKMIPSEETEILPKNLFSRLWSHPRAVFRFVTARNYDRHVTLLLILAGIANAFDKAAMKGMGDDWSLAGVISFCIIAGGMLGWITIYIYGTLVSWTGEWLGGRADARKVIRVMAYASFPSTVAMIFLMIQVAVYGIDIFRTDAVLRSGSSLADTLYYSSVVLEFILAVYSIVLLVIGVSEVQKFKIFKAILNLLLPALLLISIILLIYLIFGLM